MSPVLVLVLVAFLDPEKRPGGMETVLRAYRFSGQVVAVTVLTVGEDAIPYSGSLMEPKRGLVSSKRAAGTRGWRKRSTCRGNPDQRPKSGARPGA